ncbi:MAG: rhodanese-like domain-containing protein [Patescibacteria group bacterium]
MITESSPAEFKNTISRPEVEIVDVRSHAEFVNEHIHGAKNLDIASPIFDLNARLLQKHKVIAVYCRNGHLSQKAAEILEKMGFPRIVHLYQGLMSWKMMNLPLEASKG